MLTPSARLAAAPPLSPPPGWSAERLELHHGLLDRPAHIDPKFLYDALGSSLFAAITQLPEYYPTRCEAEIHAAHGAAIARHAGAVETLLDLGAGDCAKAERLFPVLRPRRYVPIDISTDYLEAAARRLRPAYPELRVTPLGQDFSQGLSLPADIPSARRLFFYPGSSIGNLNPDDALAMLRHVRGLCPDGGLLIGVDRVKPREVLEPAYDDALRLTAAFNLNLLRHVNALLASDFQVEDWRHVALYNAERSRIEMHLEARRALRVRWPGGERAFQAGERIHTENSYKFTPDAFQGLLERAGYRDVRHWSDTRGWFSVFLATPEAGWPRTNQRPQEDAHGLCLPADPPRSERPGRPARPLRRRARRHDSPGRAAQPRRLPGAIHAGLQPRQMASGAHHLVFETFLLSRHAPGYRAFHPSYRMLFNSYYNAIGARHPRPQRGCSRVRTWPRCCATASMWTRPCMR